MALTNTNKEKQLIGLALAFPDDADDMLSLSERDFYHSKHKEMFKVLKDMYLEGNNDWSAFARKCGIEGHQVIALTQHENIISGAQIPGLVAELKDLSRRRLMTQAGYLIQKKAEDFNLETNDILGKAARYIENATVSEAKEPKKIIDIAERVMDKYLKGLSDKGILSGLKKLDQVWSGLYPSELTVIAGRPSMGKTAVMQLLAERAAKESGLPVPFFSLEMSEEDLVNRYIASDLGVNVDMLRRGMYSREKLDNQLDTLLQRYAMLPIRVQDESEMTTFDIAAQCRKIKRKEGLGAVFVDYLTLLGDEKQGGETEALKVSTMVNRLRSLAKNLMVPVVVAAQLNRRPELRENKRPIMSDLGESGGIEAAAHNILLLYRNEYYFPEKIDNTLEIIVAKQRQGPRGVPAYVFYDASGGKFGDLAQNVPDEGKTVWGGGVQD